MDVGRYQVGVLVKPHPTVEQALADERASDPIVPDFRAKRACKRCGFERMVKVRIERVHVVTIDGDRWRNGGESYEEHCTACKFEIKALHYTRLAVENRRRADAARSKQDGKG